MMKPVTLLFLFFTLLPALVWASPPVPFSGKVAIDGVNFHGQAQFAFAIRDQAGAVHWRNGATANAAITVSVFNGRYVVLLGGQGMNPLPASLFANHDELYIRVRFDKGDGQGLVHLAPDQRITAVPYALTSKMADSAKIVENSSITTAQLNEQILKYLKPEITLSPQAPGLIFGGQTITLNSRAEGKYITYQWHKDGQLIAGATNPTITIADFNGSQHEGNYTLVVSNDFGSVTTQPTSLQVDATSTSHTVASVNMNMIFCPPGTFTMGSPTTEAGRRTNETEHNVTLTKGFYLGKYEVTQAQYEAVRGWNPSNFNATGNGNHPVEKVNWTEATAFCAQLTKLEQNAGRLPTGWNYVLPTEAEWEYACRAGTTTAYSWGDDIDASRANWNHGADLDQTVNVGQFPANPWGFYDMHGNVLEWVADRYEANYTTGSVTDPTGPSSGSDRIRRGASWIHDGTDLRSARRGTGSPGHGTHTLGFRVAFKFTGKHSVDLNATVAMDMLWVPAGTFTMGSPTSEPGREADREDEHNVTLTKGFYLGKYEVTQAQYEAVMTGNANSLSPTPSEWPGNPNRPAEKVSWDDAQVFLTRLNAQQAANLPAGWSYVLPTESQWEYACRAGTTTAYSWGATIAAANANWNHGADPNQTVNVGQFSANPWGFFDMHGNVWEWTADWYQAAYPTGNPVIDPTGPASGSLRVKRGGSWNYGGARLRSARRGTSPPSGRSNALGFRVGFQKQ